jgi:hypothetical protein
MPRFERDELQRTRAELQAISEKLQQLAAQRSPSGELSPADQRVWDELQARGAGLVAKELSLLRTDRPADKVIKDAQSFVRLEPERAAQVLGGAAREGRLLDLVAPLLDLVLLDLPKDRLRVLQEDLVKLAPADRQAELSDLEPTAHTVVKVLGSIADLRTVIPTTMAAADRMLAETEAREGKLLEERLGLAGVGEPTPEQAARLGQLDAELLHAKEARASLVRLRGELASIPRGTRVDQSGLIFGTGVESGIPKLGSLYADVGVKLDRANRIGERDISTYQTIGVNAAMGGVSRARVDGKWREKWLKDFCFIPYVAFGSDPFGSYISVGVPLLGYVALTYNEEYAVLATGVSIPIIPGLFQWSLDFSYYDEGLMRRVKPAVDKANVAAEATLTFLDRTVVQPVKRAYRKLTGAPAPPEDGPSHAGA